MGLECYGAGTRFLPDRTTRLPGIDVVSMIRAKTVRPAGLVLTAMSVFGVLAGCDQRTDEPLVEVLPDPGPVDVAMAVPVPRRNGDTCTYGPVVDEQRPLDLSNDVAEGFYATMQAPIGPRSNDAGPLLLTLAGKTDVRVGDLLQLKLTFRNIGEEPVTVLSALDGSAEHWRFPTYDVHARDASGQVYRWAQVTGRCGNVNPLVEDDFVRLAPGARSDRVAGSWADLWAIAFPKPGRYEVWVVYTMCDSDDVQGVGIAQDRHEQLARHDVTFGRWSSNALTITVK